MTNYVTNESFGLAFYMMKKPIEEPKLDKFIPTYEDWKLLYDFEPSQIPSTFENYYNGCEQLYQKALKEYKEKTAKGIAEDMWLMHLPINTTKEYIKETQKNILEIEGDPHFVGWIAKDYVDEIKKL